MNTINVVLALFSTHGKIMDDRYALNVPCGDIDKAMQVIDSIYDRARRMLAKTAASVPEFRCRFSVVRVDDYGNTGEQYGEAQGEAQLIALEVLDRCYWDHRFHLARFAALRGAA